MRTIETKVFTINELKGDELEEATKQAADMYAEYNDHSFEEILESARKAAEHFGMKVTDWSVGYYNRNYIEVDTEGYMELSNDEKNALVRWLHDNIEIGSDGTCPFTGVMYDCYFFDYFMRLPGDVSYNDIHKHIPEAIEYLVDKAVEGEENTIEDDDYMREYVEEMGWEFTEEGDFYGYGV